MAVVVTGGYGHCGTWIVKKLIEEGKDIIIFNRSERKIDFLEKYSNKIKFFKGDVQDKTSILSLFNEHDSEIEGIIHVAGLAGGPEFYKNPLLSININTIGTLNLLETAKIYGKKKFIYISSGSVYGERSDIPKESDPVSPSDLYGACKASTEFLGLQYASQYDMDFRAVRIYFAYGPGRMPSELYPLYQAIFGPLQGLRPNKLDSGRDQEIDFTYVGDVAKAIVAIYMAEHSKYKVYNVASGTPHKVKDIIELIKNYTESPLIDEIGSGKSYLRGPSLDITRISEEFGFKADYSIENGIREYAAWIKANL